MTYAGAFGIAIAFFAGATIIVLLVVWLSNKVTGGRGILYKFIQDYGYDDARTHDALLDVVGKMLVKQEGMKQGGGVSLYHDVGNRYTGEYWENDSTRHNIIVQTDGWHVEYQIDNGRTKTWKP